MSKKEIKKLHINTKEYLYTIGNRCSCNTVRVYESGNKSKILVGFDFDEYTQITPSMVKDKLQEHLINKNKHDKRL